MSAPLFAHLSGQDDAAILSAVLRWPWFTGTPLDLHVDDRDRKVTAAWRERLLGAKRLGSVRWALASGGGLPTMVTVVRSRWHRVVLASSQTGVSTVPAMLDLLANVPFELASFRTLWQDAWDKLRARPPGFGDEHGQLGWGCAFREAGHDRLVSRRWLDFGPWKVWRAAGDLSLVQFHDLAASPEEALRQATPGHQRMGISDTGGFLQSTDWGARLEGIYSPVDRCMEVIVAGREVTQGEMLEACFVRRARRADPDKPIERVAFVFLETAAARAHLHELWLRELECWTVEDGDKRRLDLDYKPAPSPPEWVASLSGS